MAVINVLVSLMPYVLASKRGNTVAEDRSKEQTEGGRTLSAHYQH